MAWLKTAGWLAMVLLALVIGIYGVGFFVWGIGDPTFIERFAAIPWSAKSHIIPAGLALMLGGFQFHKGLRARWTRLHRICGRAYVIFVLVGAIGGLMLAWHAPFSHATRLGFASLAVVWFYSAVMAFVAIRQGDITLHQQWMVRSYALTLAAVTLRIQLPFYQAVMGLSFEEAYAIVAWFCWIPNLIIAEWFINQRPVRERSLALK